MRKVLAWMLLALPLLVLAQTSETSERLERSIATYEALLEARQAELTALEAALAQTSAALEAQLAERERLEAEVLALSNEQAALSSQIETLRRAQQSTGQRITSLQARLGELRAQLARLLNSLHRQRAGRYARVLAQSESLFELRVRSYYLARLSARDARLIETVSATVRDLEVARRTRARQLRELAGRREALRQNQAALRAAQEELVGVIAELNATREGQLAQQRALLAEQGEIEAQLGGARANLAAELERLRAEARRAAEERRRRAAEAARRAQDDTVQNDTVQDETAQDGEFEARAAELERLIRALSEPPPAPEGAFAPPFPDPVLVKAYGEGGGSDVWLRAAAPGTAVRAVKSGVVYQAQRITANSGYTVAIQHGSELISAYSNLQPPEVELGERVSQGQILGYLGGGIAPADILQFRLGTPSGLDIVYQNPAPLLGLR